MHQGARKRVLGRQSRRSFTPARKISAPALATQPVPMTRTGATASTKRIMSWMVSPLSTWPPGELTNTSMGWSEAPASASSRPVTSRATLSVMAPNTRTLRWLNSRFSSSLTGEDRVWLSPGSRGSGPVGSGTSGSSSSSRGSVVRCRSVMSSSLGGAPRGCGLGPL